MTNSTRPTQIELQNCKRIPGGIRCYTLFRSVTDDPTATACPIAFPPPGIAGGMFELWLSLCPNPEWPIIDAGTMRRFLSIPTGRFELLRDPRNIGFFGLRHLEPGGAFLSQLSLTNNGVWLVWHPDKTEVGQFRPPLDKGFLELRYETLDSTNLHGVAFPLRAVLTRYGPGAARGAQAQTLQESEITVARISFSESDFAKLSRPSRLYALDYRQPAPIRDDGLAQYRSCVVTNDQWSAAPGESLPPKPDGKAVLNVLPTGEVLGDAWSRNIVLLFDPLSHPAEIVPQSHPLPEAFLNEQRSAVADPRNKVSGLVYAAIDQRIHGRGTHERADPDQAPEQQVFPNDWQPVD